MRLIASFLKCYRAFITWYHLCGGHVADSELQRELQQLCVRYTQFKTSTIIHPEAVQAMFQNSGASVGSIGEGGRLDFLDANL